ncbi:hypothetical protein OF83DRAFT_1208258 [Amylostereum chailletii]|nr:hypothetical protein OF83DRAFT_1208258 [Amylostereum chailletii]
MFNFLNHLPCPYCDRSFKNQRGRTNHIHVEHTHNNAVNNPTSAPEPEAPILNGPEGVAPVSPGPDGFAFGGVDDGDIGGDEAAGIGPNGTEREFAQHPHLTGTPCDEDGIDLPAGLPPPPRCDLPHTDWIPFRDPVQFLLADFLFRKDEMSASDIDYLLELWAMDLDRFGEPGPYASYRHLYKTIDNIKHSDIPWQCFTTSFAGDVPDNAPKWKKQQYHVWYRDPDIVIRNMLENPDFAGQFDTSAYKFYDASGKRRWTNFMSGNFAWRQSDKIYAADHSTAGAMYVAVILGSDKTTVSVATGHVEYHPLYLSIGNPHNSTWRAHRNTVIPIGFLAIPKSDRKYDRDPAFKTFKRQLYHASLSAILQTLHPAMTTPVVRRCPDGHFRRIIFDLGPIIADYPEQVMLAGIVQGWCGWFVVGSGAQQAWFAYIEHRCDAQNSDLDGEAVLRTREMTDYMVEAFSSQELWDNFGIDDEVVPFTNDFPRADIHELLAPDILHQIIKGSFKDHLVEWVEQYLVLSHGEARAGEMMDDIDRRLAAAPAFSGLRRFADGRRFKQWTGDDSKALMKVYIPAVAEYLPASMVQCISAFMDFCYLVRRSEIDEDTLAEIEDAVARFHHHREIFQTTGVRPNGFSLPRQHSMSHYVYLIQEFAAPNGLCSSITESRHITAVKKPWRRSNRYEALGQMLLINQRLDKLAAARADFVNRGMLPGRYRAIPPHLVRIEPVLDDDNEDSASHAINCINIEDAGPVDGEVLGNVTLPQRAARGYPSNIYVIAEQIHEPLLPVLTHRFLFHQLHPDVSTTPIQLPQLKQSTRIRVYHSARATFYAPSDVSGLQGMRREIIRSTPRWQKTGPRRDCVFIVEDESKPGMRGLAVARARLFFSFEHGGTVYPCALLDHFERIGTRPDPITGMWKTVEHLDTFLRSAHLMPVYGDGPLPTDFHYTYSLDAFNSYYVNKYIDHHANEIAF